VTDDPYSHLLGAPVVDSEGIALGRLAGVLATEWGEPQWLRILGRTPVLVPVAGSELREDGIRVAWPASRIEAQPQLEGDALPHHLQSYLLNHFGLATSIVRHAEEATVGTRVVERGRVRLQKLVEARPVSVPVELEAERIEIVREPVRKLVAAATWEDESIEVSLHVQRAALRKGVVARERVTLERSVVTERREIVDQVRVERVEVERDVTARVAPDAETLVFSDAETRQLRD
jgi:hypothetical protein